MRAMVLEKQKGSLVLRDLPIPVPGEREVLIRVDACGVCRTDLHIVDGELPSPKLPLIPGHQIVGRVAVLGEGVEGIQVGQRVGVPWLGGSCGECGFCTSGEENLCDKALYTGYFTDGGFAEYCTAQAAYLFPLPEHYTDLEAAPLLCAGLVGYRALRMAGGAKRVGFYGFGASAHLLIQVARYQGKEIYAFTRKGDLQAQTLAKQLGAVWVGDSEQPFSEQLDAALIFAPVGALVPIALKALRKGGTVICAGIHMSDIPSFPYKLLWEERVLRSVANLTREDGRQFLEIAAEIPLQLTITSYPLEKANEALDDLRSGKLSGAAVIDFRKN